MSKTATPDRTTPLLHNFGYFLLHHEPLIRNVTVTLHLGLRCHRIGYFLVISLSQPKWTSLLVIRSSMMAFSRQDLFIRFPPSNFQKPHGYPFVIARSSTRLRLMLTVRMFTFGLLLYSYSSPIIAIIEVPQVQLPAWSQIRMPPVRPMSCIAQHPPVTIADCHAAIRTIPWNDPVLDSTATGPVDQYPYFQLPGTRRDIQIPAAFLSGSCLVLVNEAMPLPEGWTLSSPKLASTKYTPVWSTSRKLAEEIMQKCPMTANGHETTYLGWALTESWIEDCNYFYKVLIRGTPSVMPSTSAYGDMVHIQGEFGGMYNLYEASGARLRPVTGRGQLGPPIQWGQKRRPLPRTRRNRSWSSSLLRGSGTLDAVPSRQIS